MNHLTDEQLSAYLDGAFKGRDAEEAGRHLASCQPCREALAELAEQDESLKPALTHDPGEAYFEDFASRVEKRIAAGGASRAPGAGFDLGRFFRSPRALAWAGAVAVVVVGGGLALMTGRQVILPNLWDRDRAAQTERAAPGGAKPDAPGETGQAPLATALPSVNDAVRSAPSVDGGTGSPVGSGEELSVVTTEREGDAKARADAPAPAPSLAPSSPADTRQARPGRAIEVRRNEAGEEVPVRRPGARSAVPAPTPIPAGGADEASRVRKKLVAEPLDAVKKSARMQALGSTSAREESAARGSSFAPPPSGSPIAGTLKQESQERDAQGEALLCGDVRDADDRPVAGAQVVLTALGRATTTDANGRFCMRAPQGEQSLSVMAVGYRESRQVVRVAGAKADARVTLGAVAVLDEKGGSIAGRAAPMKEKVALPTEPIGPPPTEPPLEAKDVYSKLPNALRGMVREAQRLEADAVVRRSATRFDIAASAWGRVLRRLVNGPLEIETRRHLAETRYRAWEIGPNSRRAGAAVEALTAFATRIPAGPERDQATRRLDRVRP